MTGNLPPLQRNVAHTSIKVLVSRSAALLCLLLLARFAAQTQTSGPSALPQVEPRTWVAHASANQLRVLALPHDYLRFREHIINARGDMTRDLIETKDGTVARLLAKGGHPLTAEEEVAERARLQEMIDSPEAFAKHVKAESSGKKMAVTLVKAMPDALLFSYSPGQPQRTGHLGSQPAEVVLDFNPNPAWTPPDLTSQALTGFAGRLWIDPQTRMMVRLEGTIIQSLNLGWGIFAHVYPGGKITVEQSRVTDRRWVFTEFLEHVTVRALMVKTVREDSEFRSSDFSNVSPMSYQDAIRLLLASPATPR